MLVSSLISAALSRMTAPGFLSESCQLNFVATVEVAEKDEAAGRLRMRAVCTNERDEVVLEGTVVQKIVRSD